MADNAPPIDDLLSEIVEELRPKLAAVLRTAFERGERKSVEYYETNIAQVTRVLREMSAKITAPRTDIPVGIDSLTPPSAERASQGTVKPRILELVSREMGTSISELERIGFKPNSIRGTLYALQKEGKIQKRGDRWYAATPESNEASTAETVEASKSSESGSEALLRETAVHDR